jgi:hypothetical protein
MFGKKANHTRKYVLQKFYSSVFRNMTTTWDFGIIPEKCNADIIGKISPYIRRRIGGGGMAPFVVYLCAKCR